MSKTELKKLEELLKELKPFERDYCNEIQADVIMLQNGYLVGTYDHDTDKMTSYCFVPKEK